MDVKEALRKQLIFEGETESLDEALNALIETRLRLDNYDYLGTNSLFFVAATKN